MGIIPANTGRIHALAHFDPSISDHPREYGENTTKPRNTFSELGIIPANTGRMEKALCHVLAQQDHPREYGENYICPGLATFFAGSSPRIRGECGGTDMILDFDRIIPANTGRIRTVIDSSLQAWDHPREYGENGAPNAEMPADPGSSPRIRGESPCDTLHK